MPTIKVTRPLRPGTRPEVANAAEYAARELDRVGHARVHLSLPNDPLVYRIAILAPGQAHVGGRFVIDRETSYTVALTGLIGAAHHWAATEEISAAHAEEWFVAAEAHWMTRRFVGALMAEFLNETWANLMI